MAVPSALYSECTVDTLTLYESVYYECCISFQHNVYILNASTVATVEIYFVTQPQPYYYSYLNHLTHITCDAIHISDTGEETPIDATPIRNGERLVVDSLPARHELVKKGGVVRGVLVRETQREDQEGVYWCQVEGGGEVVAFTRKTHILVGGERKSISTTFLSLCVRISLK